MAHWTTKLLEFGSGSLSKARVLKAWFSIVWRACEKLWKVGPHDRSSSHWKYDLDWNSEISTPSSCSVPSQLCVGRLDSTACTSLTCTTLPQAQKQWLHLTLNLNLWNCVPKQIILFPQLLSQVLCYSNGKPTQMPKNSLPKLVDVHYNWLK